MQNTRTPYPSTTRNIFIPKKEESRQTGRSALKAGDVSPGRRCSPTTRHQGKVRFGGSCRVLLPCDKLAFRSGIAPLQAQPGANGYPQGPPGAYGTYNQHAPTGSVPGGAYNGPSAGHGPPLGNSPPDANQFRALPGAPPPSAASFKPIGGYGGNNITGFRPDVPSTQPSQNGAQAPISMRACG